MTNTITAVLVPADDATPIRVVAIKPTLAGFRALLDGGDLEAVSLGYSGLRGTMYLDEEGKLKGLPINRFANAIAPLVGDVFVGPVIYVGDVDDEGYDTSVADELRDYIVQVAKTVGRPIEWEV